MKHELMCPADVNRLTAFKLTILSSVYTILYPRWRGEMVMARWLGYGPGLTFIEPPRMSYEWAPPADKIARYLKEQL